MLAALKQYMLKQNVALPSRSALVQQCLAELFCRLYNEGELELVDRAEAYAIMNPDILSPCPLDTSPVSKAASLLQPSQQSNSIDSSSSEDSSTALDVLLGVSNDAERHQSTSA